MKTLLSLFDYSGNWSKPYQQNGWNVIRHDIKTGEDIFSHSLPAAIADSVEGNNIHGLLAAQPCTDFAASGARWWKEKDTMPPPEHTPFFCQNRSDYWITMVMAVLFIIELFQNSLQFWCLENPVGRIHKMVPELGKPLMYFNPCEFGEPYTKKTALYGRFNTNLRKTWVLPLEGSMMHTRYGGKSEKTKTLRSITPVGFANAFYQANH